MSKLSTSQKAQRSKRRIQDILKQNGPQDAAYLATELGVTAMAVRQHLYDLSNEKLVTYEEVPRPKGRPAKLWRLTEEANRLFPDAHADLSLSLLDNMKAIFGEEGLNQIIAKRSEEQFESYQKGMEGITSLGKRLDVFAKLRSEEGYMATIRQDEESNDYFFVENHCPICAAASQCSNLCANEFDVIQKLFPNCDISREEHIL
ncbi:helix-turn-helix transcriptional regulator, partial [Curvivirga aplysinae]|uniref:helix-turn-helix transcriptional regulator n=1 Tax=Curvivirga aplysinae TaxID=2529852 RepID=UPI0012BB83D7